jgi:hypothetical protein
MRKQRKGATVARINQVARPTGLLAALIGIVVLVAEQLGVNLSPILASAIVILPAGVMSYLKPRWATDAGIFYRHPAAISGAAVTILVALAGVFGVEITSEAAVTIVAGITAAVSVGTPRN